MPRLSDILNVIASVMCTSKIALISEEMRMMHRLGRFDLLCRRSSCPSVDRPAQIPSFTGIRSRANHITSWRHGISSSFPFSEPGKPGLSFLGIVPTVTRRSRWPTSDDKEDKHAEHTQSPGPTYGATAQCHDTHVANSS